MFNIVLLFIVFILLYLYYDRHMNCRLNKLIPTIPNALSLIDVFNIKNPKDLMERIIYIGDWTTKNGGVAKFSCGPIVTYVISSSEDLTTVLTQCLEKSFIYSLVKPYIGEELLAATVPVWKPNRKLLNLAFKQQVLDGYYDLFNHQALRLTEIMATHADKEMDFSHIIRYNILKTGRQTTMGVKYDEGDLSTQMYLKAVEKVIKCVMNRFKYPWNIFDFVYKYSTVKSELDESMRVVSNISDQIILQTKREILSRKNNKDDNSNEDKTFRSSLEIVLENITDIKTDNETDVRLRHFMDNVVIGAFDTTSPTLSFLLVCIGSYPKVQQEIYKEIIYELGKEDRSILKEDVLKLTYLEAVIKETLRLYPIATILGRATTTEIQLKNFTIPAGCQIMAHIWSLNRSKEHWGPDADEFRPERWLEATASSRSSAFATFSLGRRNCVGKVYAMMQMKITVAHIIRKFHITADDKKIDLRFRAMLKPALGCLLTLKLRQENH